MSLRPEPLAVSHALRWAAVVALTGLSGGLSGLGLAALLHAIQHLAYGYSPGTLFNGESFLDGVTSASAARRAGVLAGCGLVAGVGWWAVYRWCRPLISIARAVMVACGAGAGLAAVYNVPLAGALYVLEGLLLSFSWRALVPAIITSVIAALVARMGLGNLPQYAVPHYASTPSLMIWSAVAGPLFGLAAVQFTQLSSSARTHAPHGAALPALCLINFVFIGLLATQLPILPGNGKGPAQVGFDGSINLELAAILLVLRVLITWTSLRAGAAGGLLTPGLCNGALLAILLGGAWSALWPGTSLGAFAVIGAAAFLASSMRVPLTALALIFEFTRPSQEFLIPMLIAVAGSVLTAEYVRNALAASASRRAVRAGTEQRNA